MTEILLNVFIVLAIILLNLYTLDLILKAVGVIE